MKYKLINSVSKKETICDKVVVDGWDYYVSDEQATEGFYGYINFQGGDIKKIGKHFADDWKKVIATTNPSIDLPKVVDEVEILADKLYPLENILHLQLNTAIKTGFQVGYNKSQETHPFSEEDVIEFRNWWLKLDIEWFDNTDHGDVYKFKNGKKVTDKELLHIWKEQKPKIVYYG